MEGFGLPGPRGGGDPDSSFPIWGDLNPWTFEVRERDSWVVEMTRAGAGTPERSPASTPQVPFSCGSSSWSCSKTGRAAAASAGRATASSSSCATPKRWALPDPRGRPQSPLVPLSPAVPSPRPWSRPGRALASAPLGPTQPASGLCPHPAPSTPHPAVYC